ncbi:hypothetical protein HMPREF1214_01803 [Bacteroides sp. HPS0048]|jgi:hypothetical protein|nr:hypothetical protein HMPREF1214_01803 [Bacteroides sp. HPS0048]
MKDESKLIQLEKEINELSNDFLLLKNSIIRILTIVSTCFLVGLIVGCLL